MAEKENESSWTHEEASAGTVNIIHIFFLSPNPSRFLVGVVDGYFSMYPLFVFSLIFDRTNFFASSLALFPLNFFTICAGFLIPILP